MRVFSLFILAASGGLVVSVVMAADVVDPINSKCDKAASAKDWEFEFGGVQHT
jgi:hypothetical protein